ncbi:MAG: hypothetical protein A2015_06180 [Spirochaetes bacterium GWF1_31_7]|nr:MAG: hypothetical protein A2Y30_04845 [Spirochaetes bacterium GWE1_32_154]OHD46643.1 MAG: hypothetical protein A2015_06180 [Spirochaetes bacterium GWF1_31_7]HBI36011.1 hypothetical protein [Spirochaetia bacterium]
MESTINYNNDFSAKEPSLGYFYQLRYGLLELLKSDMESVIYIESLDDILLENKDKLSFFQTKYHKNSTINLTDRSTDFWKTMRVWCTNISNGLDIENSNFYLITTEKVSDDSIIFDLKEKKDIKNIIEKLNEISKETTNKTNAKGYSAYNNLGEKQKTILINRIKIIDTSIDFLEIKSQILKQLRMSTYKEVIELLFERLEGWWFANCLLHLQGLKTNISYSEMHTKIIDIAESFQKDNLPIDFPEFIDFSEDELIEKDNLNYVKQLKLINATNRIIKNATSDYYRAYEQKSKWLSNDLINPVELSNYDSILIDNWKPKFDLLLDECDEKTNTTPEELAIIFYKEFYVKNPPQLYIRDKFTSTYMITGSCHMLSDDLKIGWHPEYRKKIGGVNEK